MSYDSHTAEYKDYTIKITWEQDTDMGPPWKEHDGHGPVSEWTRRAKNPGERILSQDRGSFRYYDFEAAMKQAKVEQWGLGDEALTDLTKKLGRTPTAGEITAESVERDYNMLKDWCEDAWCWVMYEIKVEDPDGNEIEYPDKYLSGIDSLSIDYYNEECVKEVGEWLDKRAEEQDRINHQYIVDPATL